MLRIFEKRGASGQLKETGLDNISITNMLWIDAQDPTKDELRLIAEKTHLPLMELSEYSDTEERPRAHDHELYSTIVYSYPTSGRTIRVAPVFIFMFGRHGLLTLHKKEIFVMDKITEYIKDHSDVLNNSSTFLHYFLDTLTSYYFHFFNSLSEIVDKIEENIIRTDIDISKVSTKQLFQIKKTLIHFHKALVADRDVITYIEKGYIKRMTKKETEKFRDIYNDVVQLIDMSDTNREIITGVTETYLMSLSNTMNDIMKRLTAYASLVLVPTLISGIYGMNFRFMPELNWITGYPFALALMVLSVLILYIFFKRKRWI